MKYKKIKHNLILSNIDLRKGLKLPSYLDVNIAYLCGVLVGDGSIFYRPKKNDYVIKIVGNPKDEKQYYNTIIMKKFERLFGIIPKIKYQDSGTTYGLTLHSKTLFKFFTDVIGLLNGKKDNRLKIPELLHNHPELTIHFIRGLFDTDGCITFKKRYRDTPYYPVISLSSISKTLILQVSDFLTLKRFKVVKLLDYKVKDTRNKKGFTVINRLEMNGHENLKLWTKKIRFNNEKHNRKIEKYWNEE